jgi:hypothetical protein
MSLKRAGKVPCPLPRKNIGDRFANDHSGRDRTSSVKTILAPLRPLWFLIVLTTAGLLPAKTSGQTVLRSEALKIAETFVQHRWRASPQNVLHGRDANGIDVHTPDREGGRGTPVADCWSVGSVNVGVAYKWGGLDTPASFDAGLKAGKAAGDVYASEKRRLDGAGVSEEAVGIDCSGFICRCWKLKKRYSTYSLADVCTTLPSPAALQPADIMNSVRGHVLLFVQWLDLEKKRALFYESAPYSKCIASERDIASLAAAGYVPLRYKQIK